MIYQRESFDEGNVTEPRTLPIGAEALKGLVFLLQGRGKFVDEVVVDPPEVGADPVRVSAVSGETGSRLDYSDGQLTLTPGEVASGVSDVYADQFYIRTAVAAEPGVS